METELFRTQVVEREGVPVIVVQGDVDLSSYMAFKKSINDQIDAGNKNIVIDMSAVSYMDSSAFGVLVSILKAIRPAHGSISLIGCNSSISRALHITRLDSIINVGATLDSVSSDSSRREHEAVAAQQS